MLDVQLYQVRFGVINQAKLDDCLYAQLAGHKLKGFHVKNAILNSKLLKINLEKTQLKY